MGIGENCSNICAKLKGDKEYNWRCQSYGPLGWLETFIKLMGIGVGFASLSVNDPLEGRVYIDQRIAQMVFIGVLAFLFLPFVLVQRILMKELFAIFFGALNIIGHIILWIMMFQSGDPGVFIFIFCFLFTLGDGVKLMFLFITPDFEQLWFNKIVLFVMTIFCIILYVVTLILQIVIYLTTYPTD